MTSPGPWSWGAGAGKWVLCDANDKRMISFHEWSIEPGDMSLIAAAPELAEMLSELQFGSGNGDSCSYCSRRERDGHTPECRLGRLLGRVK